MASENSKGMKHNSHKTNVIVIIIPVGNIKLFTSRTILFLETQNTYCTKEKTSLHNARPKHQSSRCEQEVTDLLTSDCRGKIYESQSKNIGPRRKRSIIIQGSEANVISNYPYHKHDHRRLQIKCDSSVRNFGVKDKPTRRLRKWSSWPVVSYPGLAELNQCVKRYVHFV